MSEAPFAGVPAEAHAHFQAQLRALRAAGLDPSPDIELRLTDGIGAWCDLSDGHIYLGVPDAETPAGSLHILYLCHAYGLEGEAELLRFSRLLLPLTIAHELGHHLRVRHGLFGAARWWEEQIANQLARVLGASALTPPDLAELDALLGAVLGALIRSGGDPRDVDASYDDRQSADRVRRARVIAAFDEGGAMDPVQYMHLQMGWIRLSLSDARPTSLRTWARAHLGACPSACAACAACGACATHEPRTPSTPSQPAAPAAIAAIATQTARFRPRRAGTPVALARNNNETPAKSGRN